MNDIITQDKDILGGKPIIKGTRMSVEVILELVASGMTIKEILDQYDFLTEEQVKAALRYAASIFSRQETYIFTKQNKVKNEISS